MRRAIPTVAGDMGKNSLKKRFGTQGLDLRPPLQLCHTKNGSTESRKMFARLIFEAASGAEPDDISSHAVADRA